MLLLLQRSAQQEAELQTYLQAVQDPNSTQYRQWLSPEEFGRRFGVADADLGAVQQWLTSQGFTVNRVSPGRIAIEFSGTFGQVESAFHTSLHRFVVEGEEHWANTTDPQIPRALAPVVGGVVALHNFSPHSLAVRGPSGSYRPDVSRIEPLLTTGNLQNGYVLFMSPADAATVYNTTTSLNPAHTGTAYDGTGVTIGIAGDSNIDVQQNANFRATFGLPAKATQVIVDGTDPGENGDAIEAYLDTEVASGAAPGANVVLYTAADTYLSPGLYLAIMRAIDNNAVDVLNVSFGSCEAGLGSAGNQFIYQMWQQAAAQGISVTVSSGDSGSAGCDNPNTENNAQYGLGVNGLASTPFNIAVGGTDFDTLYSSFPGSFTKYVNTSNAQPNHRSALSYIPEEPWNDSTTKNGLIVANSPLDAPPYYYPNDIVAAGGGVSSCVTLSGSTCSAGYPVPSWQSTAASDKSGRNLPDVSFLAGNGFYGAVWALCTDQDYISAGQTQPDCVGTPTTGANFNVTGVGGTSASAPFFAGVLALAAQKNGGRLGQADTVLYGLAKSKYGVVFHDVTTGNNSVPCVENSPNCTAVNLVNTYFLSGYNTAAGFDEATGLGSVDATQLLNNWASSTATSTHASLTLNGGTSAITITHGDAVATHVDVTGSGGTPSGVAALVDSISPATLPNGGSIASFALSGGSADETLKHFPGGSYNVGAHYAGDGTFAASDSNVIAVTVKPEASSTDLKVRGYYDPSTGKSSSTAYYGYIFLLDAQPYGNSASLADPNGAASGDITFNTGNATLGTAPISSNGVAELQTATIPGGANSLKASFPGDASFQASTSTPVALTVVPAVGALNVTSDKEAYSPGDSVVLTAKFANSSGGEPLDSLGAAPSGTVSFVADGSAALGTAAVAGTAGTSRSFAAATATLTAKNLPFGNHTITATYSGDSNYAAATTLSSAFIQVLSAATTVTLTPQSATIKANQALPLTANLTTAAGISAPTGSILFSASRNTDYMEVWSGSAPIANGVASATIPANTLPLGSYTLSAFYTGDAYYSSGSYSVGTLVVTGSGTVTPTLALTLPSAPISQGLPVTLTVGGPSGSPVPTGPVSIPGYPGMYTLVNGSVSFTLYGVWPPGPNSVTVTYLGDSTYQPASATGSFTQGSIGNISVSPLDPSVYVGNPVTLSIKVLQVTPLPVPTGTIQVTCGPYSSGAVALSAGSVSVTIPGNTLPIGTDAVEINYSGDAYYSGAGVIGTSIEVSSTPPGFTITGQGLNLAAGATAYNTSIINVMPVSGFTGQVTLSARVTSGPANAVHPPSLSFGSTGVVTISDANGANATLTVTTTGSGTAMAVPAKRPGLHWGGVGAPALCCLFLLGRGRRRLQKWLGVLLLAVAFFGGMSACGGGGGSSSGGGSARTTPGLYTITITGTASQTTTATGTISVTVN